ncbi:MAG: DNA mismatch repair endonuclease MutL [Leptospira sp.]|nr:DNA mismatch repair endonuclease MutL [Leptospira sp.]
MGIIRELSASLINKIAAGEVIESAHSVVKEILENSIDAGSDRIEIETKSGGLELILVSDNGSGIEEDDIELALKRHATSKIRDLEDIESVLTFGFRGEALSSIASVARLSLVTGTSENKSATEIFSEKGVSFGRKKTSARKGTSIKIEDLFYNTPVRRKFLKSEKSEDKKIKDRIAVTAMAKPGISFKYIQNGKEIFNLQKEELKERIISIFGENLRDHLLEVGGEMKGMKANGFISDPDFYKSNRSGQFIFVNGRPIEIKYSSFLLRKCYDELIPPGAHPWCFLFFEIDPKHIDVNVHPAKKEIRFLDEEGFNAFFLHLVNSELRSKTPVSFLELKKRLSYPSRSAMSQDAPLRHGESRQVFQDTLIDSGMATQQHGFSLENIGPGVRIQELTDQVLPSQREFVPKKHFGLLFETFILAEAEDGLYIIDQHTAHERIRYEEVLRKLRDKKTGSQPLLTPIRIDVSRDEAEEILERAAELGSVGIEIDSLGEGTVVVRSVPSFLDPGKEKETIIDFLNRSRSSSDEKELYDLMAKCVACRSAIKKGDHLSDHILGEILNRLSYCENPSRCPHGRPTLVKLTRDDLERMFHRK